MHGGDIVVDQQPLRVQESGVATSGDWLSYGAHLKINKFLFERGLVVIKYVPPYEKTSLLEQEPDKGFILGGRTLVCSDLTKLKAANYKKSHALYLKLVGNDSILTPGADVPVIVNKRRREEVFFPLYVRDHNAQSVGFYIYPRISGKATHTDEQRPVRFNHFVTAVCMLGSSLVGIDQRENELSLIKHGLDTALFTDQRITAVEYREELCSYEKAVFVEFEHLLSMARHLSEDSGGKTFLVHMPGFDYLLFAADLVAAGQMTLGAFEQLSHIIIERSAVYKQKLESIFQKNPLSRSTDLLIQSPFENIFGSYDEYFESVTSVYDKIRACLNCDFPELGNIKDNQRDLVEKCLEKLVGNTKNSSHRAVWADVLSALDSTKRPCTMEELLRLANAVMVAYASRGYRADQTCSILPITEKQIQVAHEELPILRMNDKHTRDGDGYYSDTCYVAYVDTMITYKCSDDALEVSNAAVKKDATKRGLPFYFNRRGSEMTKLIEESNILSLAHQNIGSTLSAVSLESVLQSNEPVVSPVVSLVVPNLVSIDTIALGETMAYPEPRMLIFSACNAREERKPLSSVMFRAISNLFSRQLARTRLYPKESGTEGGLDVSVPRVGRSFIKAK